MKYIKCDWYHCFLDEPVVIYAEIDDAHYEVRKIEIFSDGKIGYASLNTKTETTALGIVSVPSNEEINQDSQFHAENITKEEFEFLWSQSLACL